MSEINLKINLSYGDEYMSANITRDALLWQFICWGIFLPIVSLIGIVGNALTIVVLWRKEMQSTTILYMRALVLTDTGILLTSVIVLTPFSMANYLSSEPLKYFNDNIYPVLYTPINYVVMTLQSCNVWITVSVSVERYIAICHPFKAARICTRKKTLIVIVAITLVSVLYNIPRLFATYARECQAKEQTSGTSCYYLADTEVGRTYMYKTIYYTILYTILIFVIPLASLFILNVFLIQELMRMQRRRSGTSIHDDNEANLSQVLVLIVVVFIFCQSPGLVSQFDIFDFVVFLKWIAVSNLLFVINSAVNFLIYTAFGSKFRKVLLRVFRRLYSRSRGLSLRGSMATTNGYELSAIQDNQVTVVDSLAESTSHKVTEAVKDERTPLTSKSETYCGPSDGLSPSRRGRSPASKDLANSEDVDYCRTKDKAVTFERAKSPVSSKSPVRSKADVTAFMGARQEATALLAQADSSDSLASQDSAQHAPHALHNENNQSYEMTGARNASKCDIDDDIDDVSDRQIGNNNDKDVKNAEVVLLRHVDNNGSATFHSDNNGSATFHSDNRHSLAVLENGSDVKSEGDHVILTRAGSSDGLKSLPGARVVALKMAVNWDSVSDGRVSVTKSDSCHCLRNPCVDVSALHKASSADSVKNGRVALKKAVSSDSVKHDRRGLSAGHTGQENGHAGKADRCYPLTNCVLANGPAPADV